MSSPARLFSRFASGASAVAGVLGLALALGCGGGETRPERSNILLITIDTLRADHLSSYGYARATSPVLDRLAAEGLRFDQAAVQWPKTGPSFASIFTSTYPNNNGIVRKVGIPLPAEFLMLAEVLQRQGYGTHAVVANGALAREFNFHQGFDTYIETWKLPPTEALPDPTRADGVNALAAAVVEGLDDDKPYFLWVHYLDPHFPYTPPGEFSDMFQNDEHFEAEPRIEIDRTARKRDMLRIGAEQVLDERDDLGFYVARYDAEIAYNDAEVGKFLEMMETAGRLENTLTVITSDHGESLGEHGYYFDHGRFGFQTCLRVPLIFHYPGVIEPRVDPDPVALVDLSPTLLEAAGVDLAEGAWAEGRTLWPRLGGDAGADERPAYVFSEAGYGRRDLWQRIVRTRQYKLMDVREGDAQRWVTFEIGKRFVLYDLEADPGELENLVDARPEIAERLKRVLEGWYEAEFDALLDAGDEIESREMDEKTRDQLKALGYL